MSKTTFFESKSDENRVLSEGQAQATLANFPPLESFAEDTPVCSERLIEHVAQSALEVSGHRPLRHINCEVHESIVTLSGHVPSYYMKQLAQATVQPMLPSGLRICNKLEVSEN